MEFNQQQTEQVTLQNSGGAKSSTFAYSPDGLLKVYWLQKRNNVLLAIEDYQQRKLWKARAPTVFIYARLHSLWLDLKPALKRRWTGKEKKKQFNHLDTLLKERKDIEKMLEAFDIMNEWLDDIGITRVDTRIKHNASNPEEENRTRGY